jgi:transcription elongation GreA/GreB family factor
MPNAAAEMKKKSNKKPEHDNAEARNKEQLNKLKMNHKVVLYDLKERQNITVRLVKGSPNITNENVYDITIDSVLGSKIINCKVGDIIRVNEFEYRVVRFI